MTDVRRSAYLRIVAGIQALYFIGTGIWPLVHLSSFLAVTGPKDDIWLVETVGVLVAAVGLGLAVAALRDRVTMEVAVIGVASAIGLATVDVVYVLRGRIEKIYLLDVAIEGLLLAAWAACWWQSRVVAKGR